jgi:hypothetical protein
MRTTILLAALGAAVVAATGCEGVQFFAPLNTSYVDATPTNDPGATLHVENRSTLDVRIYVVEAGQPLRLGEVTGLRSQTFNLPSSLLTHELVFYADPVGSPRRLLTDKYRVAPGNRVHFMLDSDMTSYALSVYQE